MSWFGNVLRGIGKGAQAVGKTVLKGVSLITGGQPQVGGPSIGGMGFPVASGGIGGMPSPNIPPVITAPTGSSGGGGLLGMINGVTDFFNTTKEAVQSVGGKVGGALDVISGEKAVQVNATSDLIPKWVFPLLGGFAALLLFNTLKKKS